MRVQVQEELLLPVLQEEARPNCLVKSKVAVAVAVAAQLPRSAAKNAAQHECMVSSYGFIVASRALSAEESRPEHSRCMFPMKGLLKSLPEEGAAGLMPS